jgi:hypothetical protein
MRWEGRFEGRGARRPAKERMPGGDGKAPDRWYLCRFGAFLLGTGTRWWRPGSIERRIQLLS